MKGSFTRFFYPLHLLVKTFISDLQPQRLGGRDDGYFLSKTTPNSKKKRRPLPPFEKQNKNSQSVLNQYFMQFNLLLATLQNSSKNLNFRVVQRLGIFALMLVFSNVFAGSFSNLDLKNHEKTASFYRNTNPLGKANPGAFLPFFQPFKEAKMLADSCQYTEHFLCTETINIDAIAPDSLLNIQWFKDSIPIAGATNDTLVITTVGSYYYTATTPSGCDGALCCPIVVTQDACSSLGDLVWNDTNGNGQQDPGEGGVENITVNLYDLGLDGVKGGGDDQIVATTATDANGNYLFENLNPGQYYVQFDTSTLPDGHVLTAQNSGADATDSDANAMGMTDVIELSAGENDLTVDAGILPLPASLGDLVWYDLNGNGQQDPGETGVENVTVNLYDLGLDGVKGGGDDQLVSTTVTDVNGNYLFENLNAGSYYVQFDLNTIPVGFTLTSQNTGNDVSDSDANVMGMTDVVTLAPGDENLTIDAGVVPPAVATATIGNQVWFDNDHDGIQDGGTETGVPNVTVYLMDLGTDGIKNGDDQIVSSDLTDANGFYLFENLAPGSYYIMFDLGTIPNGYVATLHNAGGDDATDSDANAMGMDEVTVLEPDEIDLTHDLGIYNPVFDLALIKKLAPGQPAFVIANGLATYRITVYNQGEVTANNVVVTDFIPTQMTLFDLDWTDNLNGTASYTLPGSIAPGGSAFVDITLRAAANPTVSAFVNISEISHAEDEDGNVQTDEDSTPDDIKNNDVVGGNNLVDNSNGDEDDSDYEVVVFAPLFDPIGYVYCDKTGKIITGGTISVTPPPGGAVFFVDTLGSGMLDGSNGKYWFITNGQPGIYTMTYSHPNGFPLSTTCFQQPGAFDPTGNDGNPAFDMDGISNNNVIEFGQDTLPGGMYLGGGCAGNPFYLAFDLEPNDPFILHNNIPVSCTFIGSLACFDTDGDDQFSPGDQPAPGIWAYLYDCGDLNTPLDSVLTGADGKYSFDGLTPGDFTVGFGYPGGYRPIVNGPINPQGFSPCITLAWGECDTTNTQLCLFLCDDLVAGGPYTICEGESVQVAVTGGAGVYNWAPTTGLSDPTIPNPIANPTTSTTYTVSYDDGFGCSDQTAVQVNVISFDFDWLATANASADCDAPNGSIIVDYDPTNYQMEASITNGLTWVAGDPAAFLNLQAGTYTVIVRIVGTTCTQSQVILVPGPLPIDIISTVIAEQFLCNDSSTLVTIVASQPISTWNIQATSGYDNLVVSGNTMTFNAFLEGVIDNFQVILNAANGCSDTVQFELHRISAPVADFIVNEPACLNNQVCFTFTGTASVGAILNWDVADGTIVSSSPATATAPAGAEICVIFPTSGSRIINLEVNDGGCISTHTEPVNVKKPPTALAGADKSICLGSCTTLSGNTIGGLQCWWEPNTVQSHDVPDCDTIVCPTTTTNYVLWVCDANGCKDTDTIQVSVTILTPAITGATQICNGTCTDLTASGGVSYLWSTGATTAIINVCPTATTTYTVTVTNFQGCTASATHIITVNPLPTATISGPAAICAGQSVALTATGGVTYLWSNGGTMAGTFVSPATTTTYFVTVTDGNGCTATASHTILVNPLPTANAGLDQIICLNSSAILTATGGATYLWSNGATTASTTVTPLTTTTYTVIATSADGCTDTDDVLVTVDQAIATAAPSQTICIGFSATITATGGVTYLWSNGETTASITVSPATTTVYTVTATNGNGCTATASATITVNPAAVATISGNLNICAGGNTTLTAAGGTSFIWNTGATTASIFVNPATTTTYQVTVTDANGCTGTASATVVVEPLPIAAITGDLSICVGQSTTLTATGGATYLWNTGATTASIDVSPIVSTTYTVTVYSASGCSSTTSATVVVPAAIVVSISPGNVAVCPGSCVMLMATATGGQPGFTWAWSPAATLSSPNEFMTIACPIATTTYTVTATDQNGCTATASLTIEVKPTAQASITSPDLDICAGQTTSLTANGGGTYTWNTGATTATISVNPTVTTTYTVTITGATGCPGTATASATVVVNPLPNPSISGDLDICQGETTTLTATGGGTYLWNTGATTASISVNPAVSTSYTVTITSAAGCTASVSATVNVNANPIASIGGDLSICLGESTTLTASGGTSFLWSTGATTASINVNPSATTSYSVTVSNAAGCTSSASVTVTVNSLPTAAISGDLEICVGESTTLTASGGISYNWSTGATTASINVSPAVTTNYVVTVTNSAGCTDVETATVTVNPLPTAVISGDLNICTNQFTILTASGGGTYLWSTGATTAQIQVGPAISQTYFVTVTSANGCTAVASATVTVGAGPSVDIMPGDVSVCPGSCIMLMAMATGGQPAYTFAWAPPSGLSTTSGQQTLACPAVTTTYVVTVTDANGCTASNDITVTVKPIATATITSPDLDICIGQSTTLTASGGSNFAWSNGATTATITVNPTTTTTYAVTVSNGVAGCPGTATASATVTVNPLPNPSISGDLDICVGQSTTLTASGGATYLWSTGATTASISVNPLSTTSYTVTVTSAAGCTASISATVNVSPNPTPAISGDLNICAGESTTLTATGGASYLWSNGATTASINVNPTTTTSYTVTATNAAGCTGSATVTVIVNPLPTAAISGDLEICIGQSTTLTASGGNSYSWSTGATTASINVSPATTTSYSVTVTNANGCTDVETATVIVNPLPTASISGDLNICTGQSTTLTATGGTSFIWNTGATTASITVNPLFTTSYSVTVTNGNGCTATASVSVNVGTGPTVEIMPGDVALCPGSCVMLMAIATGGQPNYTFAWSPGAGLSTTTGQQTLACPTVTTTYIVTVTDANGCTATNDITVTIKPLPTANITSPDLDICIGQSTTLTASGGSDFVWSNGATTATISVNPTTTTTYTVTVSNGVAGCPGTATASATVTVNPPPTPSISGDLDICVGQSTTLTASGGTSFIWNTGATTASISVNPLSTTSYTVTVTSAAGCTASVSTTVNVSPNPTPSISGDLNICAGESTTLTASGGASYLWSTGATTASVSVNPTTTTSYTVTATNAAGCTGTATVTVIVNPLPTASISGDLNICIGESTTLTASGGTSFNWSTGATTASINVSPATTTSYSVTVTNGNGCTDVETATVIVNPLPTASISGNLTVCLGSSTTLTATGGTSFIWNTGATTASITVNPVVATTYSVTVTNANGCSASASVFVNIETPPTVEIMPGDVAICPGSCVMLMAIASGGTPGYTYSWSPAAGLASTNTQQTLACPAATTTYVVTATDAAGCTATNDIVVTIKPGPTANAGADQTICAGQTATLTASGGDSYLWSNGATTATTTVNPLINTNYTVTVTGSNGCTDTDDVLVNIGGNISVNAGADQTICSGQSATLTATGGTSYTWSTGATTASINVSPAFTTTYTVTVSNGSGCTGTDAVVVNVGQQPTANAGADQTICTGQATQLNASGGSNYVWSDGQTGASITVIPSATTTYTVTVSNAGGCSATDAVTITVIDNAAANAGPDQTICTGATTTLTATGGTLYMWSNGLGFGATKTISPTATTTYTVTVSAGFGCTATDQVTVTVATPPIITEILNPANCGQSNGSISVQISNGSGNYSYQWTGSPSTTASANNLAAGTYRITVTDTQTGCTNWEQWDLPGTPNPNSSVTATAATCSGNNGSINVNATNGTTPYVIDWNGTANGSANDADGNYTIQNLPTGNYGITVTDANGCTSTQVIVVPQNSQPISVLASSPSPVSCFGGSNGVISVNIQSGSPSFTITRNGILATSTGVLGINILNNLPAGNYNIVVTDASGCSGQTSATVTQPASAVDVQANVFNANCCGQNGSISVQATGGTPNYTYTWSPNVSSGNNATGLAAGVYSITATDSRGCTDVVSATVIPDCSGCQDIVAIDSVAAIEDDSIFVCLPGWTPQSLDALDILLNGNPYLNGYHGCDYDSLVIYNYVPLTATGPVPYRLLSWTCNGGTFSDSTIANIADLVAKMNVWDPTGNWQLNTPTNNIVGGQPNAGIYGSMSFVNLNNWTPATLNPNYGGIATGTALIIPGTPGKHTIIFTDPANCCKDTLCVYVSPNNNNPNPTTPSTQSYTIQQGQSVSDCFDLSELPGAAGSVASFCSVDGGVLTFNGTCWTYVSDVNFVGTENLCVSVCSGNVCDTFYININVQAITPPCNDIVAETDVQGSAPACNQNGSVCIGLSLDLLPNYTVSLDGGAYSGGFMGCNFDSAFAYLYSTVPNQGAVGPYDISWPVNGTAHTTSVNNVNDLVSWMNVIDPAGTWAQFAATLTIRGGVQANSYGTMSITQTNTGGSATLDPSLSLLPQGISLTMTVGLHSVVFTEKSTGCKDTVSVQILCPDVADQITNVSIQEGFNGTLCLSSFVTNGSAIASVTNICPNSSGSNASVVVDPNTDCVTYTGLVAGIDTACLQICLNTGQCFTVTAYITVTPNNPCLGFIERDTFFLANDNCTGYEQTFCVDVPYLTIGNFAVTLNGQIYNGGFASCNYEGTGSGTGTEITITEGGTHKMVFVNTNTGCSDTITVSAPCIILKPDYLTATIDVGQVDTICLSIEELPGNPMSVENACPGTQEYVIFDKVTGTLCYLCTGIEPGIENVCFVICDDQGFCDTTYMKVTVRDNAQELPVGVVDVDTILANTQLSMPVLKNDATGALTTMFVSRQPENGVVYKNPDNTIQYVPFRDFCDEKYPDIFEYVICNQAGCDTVQVYVLVLCDEIRVYTGFSPNNDQMNDTFVIEGLGNFPDNKLTIFNRWGNKIYEKKEYDNTWDGTWKNNPLPDGTYFWMLEDGKGKTYSGYVQMMR